MGGRTLLAIMGSGARGFGHGFGEGFAGGFGGGFGGRRGGGGGRGRSRLFGPGELRLLLLHLVAEVPRHGYELIKAIEELTKGTYAPSPGVVYPTLSLMTDEGIAEEAAGEGSRKAYAATEAGRAELAGRTAEAAALVDRLRALADAEPQPAPPVRRAMGNLMAVLRGRASSGGFEGEVAHQVAEILDEAARKIERL